MRDFVDDTKDQQLPGSGDAHQRRAYPLGISKLRLKMAIRNRCSSAGHIARYKGMAKWLAPPDWEGRPCIRRCLKGNPEFSTVLRVVSCARTAT